MGKLVGTIETVKRYERWSHTFPCESGVDSVAFTGPTGNQMIRPTFVHQFAEIEYDVHGYEKIVTNGELCLAVRFTPTEIGMYHWTAFHNNEIVENGTFDCESSLHPGFIRISPRDQRYFECSNGVSFCVMGINLCLPPTYALTSGSEFQTSGEYGTLGLLDYNRWFREFSENGGNFIRLWLSNSYFEPETEIAGELALEKFARLDELVNLARIYGIRLKFCLEHFRSLDPNKSGWEIKTLKHPIRGNAPKNMDEWFTSEEWQSFWWKKVEAYIARYGDDPTVMAWELWNEINACGTSDWAIVRDWTAKTAQKLQFLVPNQLVVNSLGSFDDEKWQSVYNDFHMDEMAFQQVHRYLDQGAPLSICHDAFHLGIDAVRKARRNDKPILLAETGAVNDCHTGPFRWYRADHKGILFHDTVYPAFFAGAAGPGQIWHWDEYVDKKNLWGMFRPLHRLIEGIDVPDEEFVSFECSDERIWIIGLSGKNHLIGMVRSRQDDWRNLFIRDQRPQLLKDITFNLTDCKKEWKNVQFISPWPKEEHSMAGGITKDGLLAFPPFQISCLFKLSR